MKIEENKANFHTNTSDLNMNQKLQQRNHTIQYENLAELSLPNRSGMAGHKLTSSNLQGARTVVGSKKTNQKTAVKEQIDMAYSNSRYLLTGKEALALRKTASLMTVTNYAGGPVSSMRNLLSDSEQKGHKIKPHAQLSIKFERKQQYLSVQKLDSIIGRAIRSKKSVNEVPSFEGHNKMPSLPINKTRESLQEGSSALSLSGAFQSRVMQPQLIYDSVYQNQRTLTNTKNRTGSVNAAINPSRLQPKPKQSSKVLTRNQIEATQFKPTPPIHSLDNLLFDDNYRRYMNTYATLQSGPSGQAPSCSSDTTKWLNGRALPLKSKTPLYGGVVDISRNEQSSLGQPDARSNLDRSL